MEETPAPAVAVSDTEAQTPVLKTWVTPQVEQVEFVDTASSPNPGGFYDFAFYGSRSF